MNENNAEDKAEHITTELGKEEVCERTLKAIRGSTKYAMLKNR